MFGLFKKDPLEKLRKEHASLLARAHKMSSVDRAKSDALVAEAAELEDRIVELQNAAS
jgi:septal ring factor EnvC (AmiA/AmiB activator)